MPEAKPLSQADWERVDGIIKQHLGLRWGLIPLLQGVQHAFGYIPPETIPRIASALGLFPSQVQGVISFYALFYTAPQGKNIVRVCRGTACHVRGGKTILKLAKQQLGINEGETTPDFEYTLETVACIGCCALAPNIVVNNSIYGNMNPKKIGLVLGNKRGQQNGA